jgi:F0F1-type ATP synthase membrane subunit b/b'
LTDEEYGDRGGSEMQIDKQEIVQMLRERGDHDKAQKAEQELPDKVDREEHQDLLRQFGINPQELISKL